VSKPSDVNDTDYAAIPIARRACDPGDTGVTIAEWS